MAERMVIDVDVPTQNAVQNVVALQNALDGLDRNTERAGDSLDHAGAAAGKLGDAAKDAKTQVDDLGKKSEDSADKVKRVGDSARKAGDDVDDAGEKAKRGTGKIRDGADDADKAVKRLGDSALGMTTAFLGLSTVTRLIEEMNRELEKVIDTRRKLGLDRLSFTESIQDLADNLQINFDQTGEARIRSMVSNFQTQTGVSAVQASAILASAQGAGFNIADPNKPNLDGTTQGFQIAAEVGRFAARTRLDPDTAGEFLKVARGAGVTDVASMQRLLAQTEQAGAGTAIREPAAFVGALVRAGAGQMAQGVPFQQVAGNLAAAALTESNPLVAATRVDQFARVATGMTDEYRVKLARVALTQGKLTPEMIAQAGARVPETEKQIAQREMIARDETELAEDRQETIQKTQREAEDIRLREQRLAVAPAAQRERQTIDLARAREDTITRQRADAREIATREQRITTNRRQLEQSRADAGAVAAYSRLSPAEQQTILRNMMSGLPDAERQAAALSVASSEYAQAVISMTAAPASSAFQAVQAAATSPDMQGYNTRNEAFRQSTVSQAQRAANDTQAQTLRGTMQGAEFAATIAAAGEADIALLRQAGLGYAGFGVELTSQSPLVSAQSENGLRAKRQYLVLQRQYSGFLRSMNPRLRARHSKKLDAFWNKMVAAGPTVTNDNTMLSDPAGNLAAVQNLAAEMGAIIQEVQADAAQNGDPIPTGFENVPLPATEGGNIGAGDKLRPGALGATPGPQSSTGLDDIPLPAGATIVPGAGGGVGPVASAAGGGVTINQTIGVNMVAPGGALDLDGRLET